MRRALDRPDDIELSQSGPLARQAPNYQDRRFGKSALSIKAEKRLNGNWR
jgi:hypothetical protein